MPQDPTSADDLRPIAARYRRFAAEETVGRSPLYEDLSNRVATDDDVLGFLAGLPHAKQQPNLLLAAVRLLNGAAVPWPAFRACVLQRSDELRSIMLSHATQTNEPARCAVLLPLLASLPQPLALIEVGPSAGLCLLPDRYAYAYGEHRLAPPPGPVEPPLFTCDARGGVPLPARLPEIVWRAGLDLNPLDVRDEEHARWLEMLIWPEQADRLARLRAAMAVAQEDPPPLHRGDLLHDLAGLAATAPRDATLVVMHTAVLTYVPGRAVREAFAEAVQTLCPYWIANEVPGVFPKIAAGAGSMPKADCFLLSLNGRPVAWTDPHGGGLDWLPQA